MWTTFLLILCAFFSHKENECTIDFREITPSLPVVIRGNRLLEPSDKNGHIGFSYGERMTITCETGGGIVHQFGQIPNKTITLVCRNGYFENADLRTPSKLVQFKCLFNPEYTAYMSNVTCYGNNNLYQVGYMLDGRIYTVYETCFDQTRLTPIYSKYTQKPYNYHFQTKIERPYFIPEKVFRDVPIQSLYSPSGFRTAVSHLVRSRINEYFSDANFISKGHLAAKTDFVYVFGQRATFHYVNCAPQWYGFNSGNWNALENDLRRRINEADYETVVFTGVYGVSKLKNDEDKLVELYLYTDAQGNRILPVPLYYYKVVYSPQLQKGTAFIGINNPYVRNIDDLMFCPDVCRGNGNFSWLTWRPNSWVDGYSFCCTIQDFRTVVHHLPHFEVNDLLT